MAEIQKNTKNDVDSIHLLRTMITNTYHLVVIADRKAGILLGVSFLSLSIILEKTKGYEINFKLGLLLILLLFLIVFTALSLIPRSKTDKKIPPNLMFFGDVSNMNIHSYMDDFSQVLKKNERMHHLMMEDYYTLCHIVNKKFKYLRYCYIVCILYSSVFILYFIWTLLFGGLIA